MPEGEAGPAGSGHDDLALARAVLEGDEASFERLFDACFPVLFRYALTRLDYDESLAGEVAQSAMCKAYEHLHRFRGESTLLTWIISILRFEISAVQRHRRTRQDVELREAVPEIRHALETLANGPRETRPDEVLDETEIAGLVRLTLDALSDRNRQALEWKYQDGLSVRDIAGRLDTSSKAAESILTRAREAFRKQFQSFASSLGGSGYRGLRAVTGGGSGDA